MNKALSVLLIHICSFIAASQTETLTNMRIIEMTKAGLAPEIILVKIRSSTDRFDISTDALIQLKKEGVKDDVISAMVEKGRSIVVPDNATSQPSNASSDVVKSMTPRDALLNAKTIAFQKSSINPSRQALEKELLKRADWRALSLTIEEYKDSADLYVEIGFVPMSLVTHRYVFRVYDRRSGVVIAAGETTSWGSLAENLARHIARSLTAIKNGS
jgi:hypothetical protein